VPTRLVIDNAKCAGVKAVFHDPVIQHAYRDCAEHYGFLIAPCRVRTPEYKGKVEQGGVHYVVRNALAGRTFRDHVEGNAHLRRWLTDTAGVCIHGTTKRRPWRGSARWSRRPCPPARDAVHGADLETRDAAPRLSGDLRRGVPLGAASLLR
jgi:hypothetical protein